MSKKVLQQKIADGLQDKSSWIGRHVTIGHLRPMIVKVAESNVALRDRFKTIKKYSIAHLDELLVQTVENMKKNRFHVYVAETGEEAAKYIAELVGSQKVVKAKTNTGKEIGITQRLQAQGAEVYETDLGDRLAQLDGKGKSAHSLAPAAYLTAKEDAELLSRDLGENLPADATILVDAARRSLRKVFLTSEVGISGANAIAAETGAIFVQENEGNIRCVTSIPKMHIVISGTEKIVPKFEDGLVVCKTASSFGCGQDIGTYVSVINGVSKYESPAMQFLKKGQGPQDVYVVLLKQGREEAIRQGYEQLLYCVSCGSCLNTCPVYNAIGESFGYRYIGGRGTIFAAFHADREKAKEAGLSLCIGCKRCEESCPSQMAVPDMFLRMRRQDVEDNGMNKGKEAVFKMLAKNQLAPLTKLGRKFQGVALKTVGDGAVLRTNLFANMGIPRERFLPHLSGKSFAEIIGKRTSQERPKSRAAFFAGCVTNYFDPQLGVDVYDILAANGVQMLTYPGEACCGLPVLMSGDVKEARALAEQNIRLFSQEDYEYLLFVCPSCATTVMEKWGILIGDTKDEKLLQNYAAIQAKVIDLSDYLYNVLKVQLPKLQEPLKVTYHDPCHLVRGLQISQEPRQLLKQMGAEFVEMEEPDSCCGFGGSFSLFHYNVSRAVNDEKIDRIIKTGTDYTVTGCPGCVMHIKDGLYQAKSTNRAVHIAHLIAEAYRQEVR